MASRTEVVQYIKTRFNFEELIDDDFENFIKVVVELGVGRSQLVFATVSEDFMSVQSPFAGASDISADQALRVHKSIYGIGILNSNNGDLYAIRHVIPLQDVDESEIDFALTVIPEFADQIEQSLGLGDSL